MAARRPWAAPRTGAGARRVRRSARIALHSRSKRRRALRGASGTAGVASGERLTNVLERAAAPPPGERAPGTRAIVATAAGTACAEEGINQRRNHPMLWTIVVILLV